MASRCLVWPAALRLVLAPPRLSAQSARVIRPLCQGPPDSPEQSGKAKDDATDKNDDNKEKLLGSQNVEIQLDHEPPREAEEKQHGKSETHDLKQESTAKEEAAAGKDEKTSSRNRLHNLLVSLASADPIPVEPRVQLSHPKARRRKDKTPGKTPSPPVVETDLDPEIVSATKEVAKSLGGDVKETESELLSTLRLHSTETTAASARSLSELFVGMKVERKPKSEAEEVPRYRPSDAEVGQPRRLHPRDRHLFHRSQPHISPGARTDLFGGKPLGIFKAQDDTSKAAASMSVVPTWERLHHHELQQSVLHPPSNAFMEMIQWTNEGKLWTFPIDNETGLEEEKKIGFHEHVFLERHLEGWCPPRGPIRHFMELVCTGLSKNPHLTVERKKAHIAWYKNYFGQKEELLKELGAIEVSQ